MKSLRIAVIPGDGIGVDVTAEAVKALSAVAEASGRTLVMTPFDWGAARYLSTGVTLPPGGLEMLEEGFDAILFGALGDPRVPDNKHAYDILLGMRFRLDLYVNYRPVRLFSEKICPLKNTGPADVDFVVFRENTEGLYVMMGGNFKKDTEDEVATEIDLNTRKGVERIVRYAFEYAVRRGRTRVTMADKANVLVHAHDLWQRVFKAVAAEYPGIEARHLYVDNLAFQLVRDPRQFEVIVTSNMFGDIVTDLAAGLQGRAGHGRLGQHQPRPDQPVRAGARLLADHGRQGRCEPHGRHPDRGPDARAPRLERGGRSRGRGRALGGGERPHDERPRGAARDPGRR